MANVYTVEIGQVSRRGAFQVLTRKFVQSDCHVGVVRKTYQDQYDGFEVRVSPVESVEELAPPEVPVGGPPVRKYAVGKYAARLSELCPGLLVAAKDARKIYHGILQEIHQAVKDQFKMTPYIDQAGEFNIQINLDKELAEYEVPLSFGLWVRSLPGDFEGDPFADD